MTKSFRQSRAGTFLTVKKNHVGYGVYADRAITRGAVICTMQGKKKPAFTLHLKGNAFRRAIVDPLQVGTNEYLDLAKPFIYINHSCNPNAGIRKKTELFALKSIQKGDEITYDYATTVDETFVCKCGAEKCRKFIPVDFFGLSSSVQRSYIARGAIPDHIIKKYRKCHGK